MKITKRQLKRIIKEERAKLLKEQADGKGDFRARMQQRHPRPNHGIFDQSYLSDIIREEIMDYLNTVDADYLDPDEAKLIERMINNAANATIMDLVEG